MTTFTDARDSRKLKIAYVIDTMSGLGGTEVQLMHLLSRLDRSRFEPRLYCLYSSEDVATELDAAPVTFLGFQVKIRPSFPMGVWRLSRILRRERVDIVQTHFRDGNLVGVLAGRIAGTPVVLSTRRGVAYWHNSVELTLLRWLNGLSTWFVANSVATKDHYCAAEGIDPERCDVIYNGLVPEQFQGLDAANRSVLRASLGVPAEATLIGIVANLRRVKGIHDLLDAASRLASRHPKSRFLIAGEGPDEVFLKDLARRLGVEERVIFLGVRRDVPHLLQTLDVGVLASHFESFSNSIMEYVAAGLPVVATDVGGAREIVQDGREGLLVPPGRPDLMAETLDTLISYPGGPRAWLQSKTLDPVFHVGAMVEAYQKLYLNLAMQFHPDRQQTPIK